LYFVIIKKWCPENSASFLSQITFWWFNGMILKGHKKPLTTDDMWTLNEENRANTVLNKFNKVWTPKVEKEKQIAIKKASEGELVTTNVNVLGSILTTFWPSMLFVGILKFVASTLVFVNPIVLDRLISFMTPTSHEPTWRGYFYASLMLISPLFESLINSQYEYRVSLISLKMRACIISVIYKKVCNVKTSKICE